MGQDQNTQPGHPAFLIGRPWRIGTRLAVVRGDAAHLMVLLRSERHGAMRVFDYLIGGFNGAPGVPSNLGSSAHKQSLL